MTKCFLFFLGLFCGLNITGQVGNYAPFPTDTAVWRGTVVTVDWPDTTPVFEPIEYSIQGDTTFNDLTYQKVYEYHEPTHYVVGGIREDSLKQIFFYPFNPSGNFHFWMEQFPSDTSEFMLYSFSDTLEIGMEIPINPDHYSIQITDIDSVLIGNEYRRRFHVSQSNMDSYTWISGIGGSNGLFSPVSSWNEWNTFLLCFTDTNDEVYGFNAIVTNPVNICNNWSSLHAKPDLKANIQVYPNPATSTITIKSSANLGNGLIKIFNTYGQLVHIKTGHQLNGNIDIGFLVDGIYYLHAESDSNQFVLKLLKQ